MTIASSINDWIVKWTKIFEQGAPATPSIAPTKLLSEVLVFMAGLPFTQIAGAALAEGTNIPLDVEAAIAITADFMKAFYSGQSVQMATTALATKVAIPAAVASQIIFDPVHPVDPTQFSRGR